MSKRVSLLIIGAGGYGNSYLDGALNSSYRERVTIKGIVDPNPSTCKYLEELKQLRIPFYPSMEEFYAADYADLAIISSPIQYHAQQSCYALEHGSNVLCEKPLCATFPDALKMREAQDRSGKFLAVGYQWSFDNALLGLKKDILSGMLGHPKRLKTLVLWPRDEAYFSRSNWSGRIKDSQGNWVFDSVANNGTAHYLHNMFFILGHKLDTAAFPVRVKAELYRANKIENFDTSVIQAFTEEGVEILFYATHAVKDSSGPIFQFEFEKGMVTFNADSGEDSSILMHLKDGSQKSYGSPSPYAKMNKFEVCVDAVVGIRNEITCRAETAMPHLLCIHGIQKSMQEIENFPADLIKTDTQRKLVWVDSLYEGLSTCYQDASLPSSTGIPWAKCGKEIDLENDPYFGGIIREYRSKL